MTAIPLFRTTRLSGLARGRFLLLLAVSCAIGGCDQKHTGLNDLQAKAFLNEKGCNACHAIDEVRLGPSFRSVAKVRADGLNQPDEYLAFKIRNGGGGAWGVVPMVANPQVSDAEARSIANWILSLPDKPSASPPGAPE